MKAQALALHIAEETVRVTHEASAAVERELLAAAQKQLDAAEAAGAKGGHDAAQTAVDVAVEHLAEVRASAGGRIDELRVVDPGVVPWTPTSPNIPAIFSYSRSSIVNLPVALAALVWLDHRRIRWRAILPWAILAIAGAAVSYYFLPQLVEAARMRLSLTTWYFFDHTEAMFSGCFESWHVLLRLGTHPWDAVFGIGYKTRPYSDYIGQTVIGDNMYLSMLVETGVLGLGALLWFNLSVLRAALRAARHATPIASFLGTWMFCFWTGQLFQMFSGDLLTYWSVLPVYFLVLAWAVRESRRAPAQ